MIFFCISEPASSVVNLTHVFAGNCTGIKKPPARQGEVSIVNIGLWCKQGIMGDMFLLPPHIPNDSGRATGFTTNIRYLCHKIKITDDNTYTARVVKVLTARPYYVYLLHEHTTAANHRRSNNSTGGNTGRLRPNRQQGGIFCSAIP